MNRLAAMPLLVGALCVAVVPPAKTAAQEPPQEPREEALRVFLDCDSWLCDFDYLRREITYVNWVRDRADAQVHVLVTTQTTGGGGTEFTLAFIGLRNFAGREDTLRYVSRATETEDEIRNGISRTLSFGLVRYAALLPVSVDLRVVYEAGRQQQPAAALPEDDPWNFWVFRVGADGYLFGEETYRNYRVGGSLRASRTTEDFKVGLTFSGSYINTLYKYPDGTELLDARHSLSFRGLSAWSLTDQWSWGAVVEANSSTYLNQDLAVSLAPGIEYDLFPYSESTRRKLTFRYSAGVQALDYEEETIFFETSEWRPIHSLEVSLYSQQPWGRLGVSVEGFQYLHDLDRHHVTLYGECDIRLFKGFSFNWWGSISRVKDQLYLAAGDASLEEILVRRRQLGTSYEYYLFGGLSYTFGSIFNNVVNPRFGG